MRQVMMEKDIRGKASQDAGRLVMSMAARRRIIERRMRILGLAVTTVLVVFILSMCVAIVSSCSDKVNDREVLAYVSQMDRELAAETRNVLNELGYKNSGITVNCLIEEGSAYTQTVTIHHDKIDSMSGFEREALAGRLSEELNCANIEFLLLE